MNETLEQIRSFQDLRKKLTYNRWTPEANDELKTLWAMHQDDVLISKKTGRSESSIAQQRYKLGLVKFKKKPGKVLDIRRPQGGGAGTERVWFGGFNPHPSCAKNSRLQTGNN